MRLPQRKRSTPMAQSIGLPLLPRSEYSSEFEYFNANCRLKPTRSVLRWVNSISLRGLFDYGTSAHCRTWTVSGQALDRNNRDDSSGFAIGRNVDKRPIICAANSAPGHAPPVLQVRQW